MNLTKTFNHFIPSAFRFFKSFFKGRSLRSSMFTIAESLETGKKLKRGINNFKKLDTS